MEIQTASFFEIIALVLFLGSTIFFIGTAYQVITLVRFNKGAHWLKIMGIVILTRFLVVVLTIIFWRALFSGTEIMFGPLLLPAVIAEITISPLVLKLFRFRIFK